MTPATRQFIAKNLTADIRALALKKVPADVDLPLALRQIEARQLLQKKVPQWSTNDDLLFPAHLSIEQCSSEATAQYKADLFKGDTFVDLTGGLGIDCQEIAKNFNVAHYVERNPELCALAEHNFSVLKANIKVWNESAEAFLQTMSPVDFIYLDPARRDVHGRKTVSIADCTPNVVQLQDLLLEKAATVAVKLSPMLDISKALGELKCVKAVHVIAVANECKELLFVMEKGHHRTIRFTCANLLTDKPIMEFSMEEERDCPLQLSDGVMRYLYEPNAALMKAGCFKLLAQRFGISKLHKNSNLYTSDELISDFPGRIFEVESWAHYNKKLKQTLLADVEKASVAVRNFPMSVAELRKTLKLADGDAVYLFATTIKGDEKVLIKTKKA
mgnify:FL=1